MKQMMTFDAIKQNQRSMRGHQSDLETPKSMVVDDFTKQSNIIRSIKSLSPSMISMNGQGKDRAYRGAVNIID
jgi:hypothetical protein